MGKFYAVVTGRKPGIYTDWATCKQQVTGFAGAIFKSFTTREEAEAFMKAGGSDAVEPVALIAPTLTDKMVKVVGKVTPTTSALVAAAPEGPVVAMPAAVTGRLTVFCDGSCTNNGKKNASATAGVVFWDKATGRPTAIFAEPLDRKLHLQTNQRAELYGIARSCEELEAINPDPDTLMADIYTDSMYGINCCAPRAEQADIPKPSAIWAPGWERRGWKRAAGQEIDHIDIILRVYTWLKKHPGVILHHVRGHQDARMMEFPFIGNAVADWATWHARGMQPDMASAEFKSLAPTFATKVVTSKVVASLVQR